MSIIVQKFGGTSLADSEKRKKAAHKVIQANERGYSCVVVVSAIGRSGAPYATDTLLDSLESKNINPREKDILLNCGEMISAVFLFQVFESLGYDSIVLTGSQAGIITDDNYTDARILKINPEKIIRNLAKGKIVIVTGFQGVTEDGELTTLGRGGSDTTAAALGVALDAVEVEIYTDVEGIKTADPRIVENAGTLKTISYNEICQLAHNGAKVIHPRAVEIARQKNIPLRVKSTFSDGEGTLIIDQLYEKNTIAEIRDGLLAGIACLEDIDQISIDIGVSVKSSFMVFETMKNAGISVDLINVFPNKIAFTIKRDDARLAIAELEKIGLSPKIIEDCAKVSVVGANMAGVPGVMASIMEAMYLENIEVLQTSDSHTSIWCLVKRTNMAQAAIALHKIFNLDRRCK